jgi:hypothetical protein
MGQIEEGGWFLLLDHSGHLTLTNAVTSYRGWQADLISRSLSAGLLNVLGATLTDALTSHF